MDGIYTVYAMEVVISVKGCVLVGEVTGHDALRVESVPWRSMLAGYLLGVDQIGLVARVLHAVETFHFHSLEHGVEQRLGGLNTACFGLLPLGDFL